MAVVPDECISDALVISAYSQPLLVIGVVVNAHPEFLVYLSPQKRQKLGDPENPSYNCWYDNTTPQPRG